MSDLHITAALPEIFLALSACAVLLLSAFIAPEKNGAPAYVLGVTALLVTALLAGIDFSAGAAASAAFHNMYVDDPLARVLKIAVCLLSAAAFVYGRRYNAERGIFTGEYYVLGMFAVTGMMVMCSAGHLLTLYLGLELMSLCLYAMIAYYRGGKLASEAAMKYFILGALASGLLLYGMSLLYGLSGALELAQIAAALRGVDAGAAHALAVVFIVCALAFKLGAVPFHMWLPDVYHGAPTSTTAFLAAAPKIAAFALLMRLLAGGLGHWFEMWQQMLLLLALLSVAAGNLIAIAQTNFKRMLAYSAISHMGFFLFGVCGGGAAGYAAALFYVLVYALMSLGAFGVVLRLSGRAREFDLLDDLKGLSARDPWSAFLLLILMLSMAGIPPTAGFFAKLSVIQSLVQAGLVWAAVAAVLLAVVGAFYYLRVIKLMYFDAPDAEFERAPAGAGMKLLLSFNALVIIAILPWINALISLCNQVVLRFGA
ncbi:MAG: NADH-quinone oxidoreductase subunit NuoN [Gammaproteobacteria bacterium]